MSQEPGHGDQALAGFWAAPSPFRKYGEEETRVSTGSAGKVAVARLSFERFDEKTYLHGLYTQTPARVLRALYYDPFLPGLPYVIFVNPTGGIVQGDRYEYRIALGEGAEAFITDSMATKIYRMDLNYASRHTEVSLGKGCRLEYLPRETIAFAGSRWYQNTVFRASEGSRLLFSEIFCPGRIASEESWDFTLHASRVVILEDGDPVLVDSSLYTGEDKARSGILFGNRTFLLSAYWYSGKVPSSKGKIEFGDLYGGVSEMPGRKGLVVKALSDRLEDLKAFQLGLWEIFRKEEAGTGVPSLRMY
ncbi:MAG TPA: urease accessory protein UreD [Methanomicrobiales archaeon]|nr:urease accessory protein UreD [Methanomicrobiales archaeon]